MRIIWCIIAFVLMPFVSLADGRLSQVVVDEISTSVVRVIADARDGKNRVASGFVWPSRDYIVTSLHVVAGDDTIQVEYQELNGTVSVYEAHIERVSLAADLALLRVVSAPERPALSISAAPNSGFLWVVGFPLGLKEQWLRQLQKSDQQTVPISTVLTRNEQDQLQRLGFPSIDQPIFRVNGSLQPGDSGAPVVDHEGNLVGIGAGGLKGGVANLAWITPAGVLTDLQTSGDAQPDVSPSLMVALQNLFVYSRSRNPTSTASTSSGFRTGFELPARDSGVLRDFVPVEPRFAPCLALSSSFTEWTRVQDAHSGRFALALNPQGNPVTRTTNTNYCRTPTLVVSAAELDLAFDTRGGSRLSVSYFSRSRSNPRMADVHNCDSGLNFYVTRDEGNWEHFGAICGKHISEGQDWREVRMDIPVEGASQMRMGFTYELQNSESADPDAIFLIDDFSIEVR